MNYQVVWGYALQKPDDPRAAGGNYEIIAESPQEAIAVMRNEIEAVWWALPFEESLFTATATEITILGDEGDLIRTALGMTQDAPTDQVLTKIAELQAMGGGDGV